MMKARSIGDFDWVCKHFHSARLPQSIHTGVSAPSPTPRPGAHAPVHQDLADLDALAARAQRVLHRLAAADDRHAAQLLREIDADVRLPRRREHRLFGKRQVPEPGLDDLRSTWLC